MTFSDPYRTIIVEPAVAPTPAREPRRAPAEEPKPATPDAPRRRRKQPARTRARA